MADRDAGRKPEHFYDEDGLVYIYNRKEKCNVINASVYNAECQTVNISGNEERTLEMPCVIKLEYYVDIKNQKLMQVIVDMEDFCKAGAISEKILQGASESDARKTVKNKRDYNIQKLIITFKNTDKDSIAPPETNG